MSYKSGSELELTFETHLFSIGIRKFEREYKFHEKRRFRFDFAWPDKKIAVEVEGGVFGRGRHTRGQGFTNDCVKYNLATKNGWRVYRFTGEQVMSGDAIQFMEEILL